MFKGNIKKACFQAFFILFSLFFNKKEKIKNFETELND